MTIKFDSTIHTPLFGGDGSIGSLTPYALDSNFTLGTGGDCVGVRFVAPNGGVHLHSVYFFLHAVNATSHDLTCCLAGYNTASSLRPLTTAIRTVISAGGTTATKWIKFDFSAYSDSLTAGEYYWVVVGDTTGSGSGYSIRSRTSAILNMNSASTTRVFNVLSNDAGFTTAGSSVGATNCAILVFSDGTAIGVPYTQSANSTSNTLERGLKFIFDEKIICSGLVANLSSDNMTTLQILLAGTAPGGSVWSGFNSGNAYTMTTSQKGIGFIQFPSPVTFDKNTYYRITLKSATSHTYPGYSEIEDYATLESDAFKTALGAGNWCYTIDNGSGGWTDYDNATDGYRLPRMSLIMQSQVPITGGGVYSFGG